MRLGTRPCAVYEAMCKPIRCQQEYSAPKAACRAMHFVGQPPLRPIARGMRTIPGPRLIPQGVAWEEAQRGWKWMKVGNRCVEQLGSNGGRYTLNPQRTLYGCSATSTDPANRGYHPTGREAYRHQRQADSAGNLRSRTPSSPPG